MLALGKDFSHQMEILEFFVHTFFFFLRLRGQKQATGLLVLDGRG